MSKQSFHSSKKDGLQIQSRNYSYSHIQQRSTQHHPFVKYQTQVTPSNQSDNPFNPIDNHAKPTDNSLTKDKSSHFQILNSFKQAQDQFQILKKRLLVLKIKDNKNNNRYQLNQRKLILHDSIQKIASLEKDKIQQWKQQNQQRVKQQKIQNLKQKIIHHRHIKSVIDTIKQAKSKDYSLRKQQQKNNQQKIAQMQHEYFTSNKNKVQNIKKLEQFNKLSLEAHNKIKIAGFKEKQNKENDSLIMKKLKKQAQIQKMMELELQMMQQQSSSRLILERSTEGLKGILNPEKNLKSSKINKSSRTSEVSLDEKLTPNLNRNHTNQKVQNIPIKGEKGKHSIHLTRESSFHSKSPKNDFSLPQIKNARKYP